jgi:hypothetical protein
MFDSKPPNTLSLNREAFSFLIEARLIISMGVLARGRTSELPLSNIAHLLACLSVWKFPDCHINYLTLGQLAS